MRLHSCWCWFPQFGFAEEPDKKELPKPLPDTIVKAWKDAGATAGWMKVEKSGGLTFVEKPEAGAIPAVPVPQMEGRRRCEVADPGSSIRPRPRQDRRRRCRTQGVFTKVKNLSSLCLCETKVTDDAVECCGKPCRSALSSTAGRR